ncbi:hypothetical protein LZ31DRAFT_273498 [Colletotrichum somersetense]|nr:hypothetical protein LZ31DRAFT_273498 [Colletotrichum somersetense]
MVHLLLPNLFPGPVTLTAGASIPRNTNDGGRDPFPGTSSAGGSCSPNTLMTGVPIPRNNNGRAAGLQDCRTRDCWSNKATEPWDAGTGY